MHEHPESTTDMMVQVVTDFIVSSDKGAAYPVVMAAYWAAKLLWDVGMYTAAVVVGFVTAERTMEGMPDRYCNYVCFADLTKDYVRKNKAIAYSLIILASKFVL